MSSWLRRIISGGGRGGGAAAAVAWRSLVTLTLIVYAIKRYCAYVFNKRSSRIQLPDIHDYLLEEEKTLAVRIFGPDSLLPWQIIKAWERMGRPDRFKSRFLLTPVVQSSLKDDVLIGEMPKLFLYQSFRRFLGHESILFQEGYRHRRERAILNHGFGQKAYRACHPAMLRSAQRLLDRMKEACERFGSVESSSLVTRLSLEVISEGGFSYDLASDHLGLSQAFRNMIVYARNPLCLLPYGADLVEWLGKEDCMKVHRVIDDAIAQHSKDLSLPESTDDDKRVPKRGDLLDTIIRCVNLAQDGYASQRDARWIRDQVQLLFTAGTDTTGCTLSWAIPYLAHFPEIQAKIKAEIKESLANELLHDDEYQRMQSLAYTEAFILELLRLFPPVSIARRLPEGETEFKGIDLSGDPDTFVFSNNYLVSRREEYFPEPDRFYPERWLIPGMADKDAFAAFSLGPRICLGKGFAMIEMKTVLALLLQDHTVEPCDQSQQLPIFGRFGGVKGPEGTYPVILRKDLV